MKEHNLLLILQQQTKTVRRKMITKTLHMTPNISGSTLIIQNQVSIQGIFYNEIGVKYLLVLLITDFY